MSYAVFVTFQVKDGQIEEFMPLIHQQAANSLTLEPGCSIFEVWTSSDKPGQVLLYEVYDDKEAFASHLASNHFKSFDQAAASMIRDKAVVTADQCGPVAAEEDG